MITEIGLSFIWGPPASVPQLARRADGSLAEVVDREDRLPHPHLIDLGGEFSGPRARFML